MSTVPKTLLTPEQYLVRERAAEFKSEFYGGEMFAMSGGSFAHSRIRDSLFLHTQNRLGSGPCFAVNSDLRVKVSATGLYTYPDGLIVCDEPAFDDQQRDTLLNPAVILEVLSDSTEKYDRGKKFEHYRQIPSLREYVLVAQDRPLVERYVRQPDDQWLLATFRGLDAVFAYGTISVQIPLTAIYHGVPLETGEQL